MTEAFVWDYKTNKQRVTDWRETSSILKEIHNEFVKNDGAIQYSHKVTKKYLYYQLYNNHYKFMENTRNHSKRAILLNPVFIKIEIEMFF